MKKESAEINSLWHVDALYHPFPVTIITTVNSRGRVNAAPYSLVMPFCESPKNPQMLLGSNRAWDTAKNILDTGEFVINYPTAEQLKDVMETARFYPDEENELEHTNYTIIPSKYVKPPRINECYQHVECRLFQTIMPAKNQVNFIADVLDISHNPGDNRIGRQKRVRRCNAPVYLGIDETAQHLFGNLQSPVAMGITAKAD